MTPVLVIYHQIDGGFHNFCMPDFNFTVFMEEYQDRFDIWFRPTNNKENDWSCFRIFSNNTGLMTSGRLDHIDFCISKQQERR
ncbi:hypothetical protein CAEBREN_08528 [Caenorhabditis brenneri]|uniref:Uncharacterized protein n=1 Tax=Caenorhabditis brenneri TaxID=135651 RepID=G0MV03_CAEBE|nr:hypothetical protein CAEBREN_08528 [Caenorhabditis brenneri]